MSRWLAALLVALTAGCGPSVIWHGHSPDRSSRVVLLETRGRHAVEIDGVRGPMFDGISHESLVFGRGGHVAYAARDRDTWFVVRDQKREPTRWGAVTELVFSTNGEHLGYAAHNGRGWRVVRDGVVGAVEMDAIFDDTIAFDDTGEHIVYAAQDGGCHIAVVDNDPGPCFDAIADLQIARGTGPMVWGYLAQSDKVAFSVINRRRGSGWESAGGLVLGPHPFARSAFRARRGGSWFAVVDGQPGPAFPQIRNLQISPDGRRLAYVAGVPGHEQVLADGSSSRAFDSVRWLAVGRQSTCFAAALADNQYVVRDGEIGPAFAQVGRPVLDQNEAHIAYSAAGDFGARLLVDHEPIPAPDLVWVGTPVWGPAQELVVAVKTVDTMAIAVRGPGGLELHPFDLVVEGSLAFSSNGHWGAIVGDAQQKQVWIVVDGRKHIRFDVDELATAVLRHPPEPGDDGLGDFLQNWVLRTVEHFQD